MGKSLVAYRQLTHVLATNIKGPFLPLRRMLVHITNIKGDLFFQLNREFTVQPQIIILDQNRL